jgi:hypothetical protein
LRASPVVGIVLAGLTFLSACTTGNGGGPIFFPGGGGGGGLAGLDRGSSIQSMLSDEDREGMSQATMALLQSGQTNATQAWRTRSGDEGTVRLGAPVLVGLDSVAGTPIAAPSDIDTSVPLEAASGNYVAAKTINVRLGPSTASPVAQTLAEGSLVRAYAKTGDWLLIGAADSIYGYAFAQLLTASGGGDPVLAGGKARRPRLCRDVALSVALAGGQRDLWSALVCKRDDGAWEVPAERGLS